MSLKESVKQILRMCGHAMVSTVHDRLNAVEDNLNELAVSHTALLQSSIHLVESTQRAALLHWVGAPGYAPETSLIEFLHPFLSADGAEVLSVAAEQLATMRGCPPVVIAEFASGRIAEPVRQMRARGYFWDIALYRMREDDVPSFFCNQDVAIPESRGHLFFFRDREVFAHAQDWCASALPRTYFRPSPQ